MHMTVVSKLWDDNIDADSLSNDDLKYLLNVASVIASNDWVEFDCPEGITDIEYSDGLYSLSINAYEVYYSGIDEILVPTKALETLHSLSRDITEGGRTKVAKFLNTLTSNCGEDGKCEILPYICNPVCNVSVKRTIPGYLTIYPNYYDKWVRAVPKAFELYEQNIKPELDRIAKDPAVTIYPNNYMRIFYTMDPDSIDVVILGQDPYHNGKATGYAFENVSSPYSPSLINIMKEKGSDIPLGKHHVANGVFLYNTALTVVASKPLSHEWLWEEFSHHIISYLGQKEDIVWLLFGSKAHMYAPLIKGPVLKTTHPSPYSASKSIGDIEPFLGSGVFKKCNEILRSMGKAKINW